METSPSSLRQAPILYSFRRCPYAIRARMAVDAAGTAVELREVLLRNKPQAMLEASPKGTVPVLVLPGGAVIDQSLDVMIWALRSADPENWLANETESVAWLDELDREFKPRLDGYKYAHRGTPAQERRCREEAVVLLRQFEQRLGHRHLLGADRTLADVGTFPFVRQFAHHDRDFFASLGLSRLEDWLEGFLSSQRFARVMLKRELWPG